MARPVLPQLPQRCGSVVGGGEAPRTVGNDADTDAHRLGVGGVSHLAVLCRQRTAAIIDHARIDIGSATLDRKIESPIEDVFHR